MSLPVPTLRNFESELVFQNENTGVGEVVNGKKFTAGPTGTPDRHCWSARYFGFM
jgi:hypothetical protein